MSKLTSYTRWAAWEGEVLARVNDPARCQKVISERQQAVDDDASEAELVVSHFRAELRRHGYDPEKDCVFISSLIAANWLKAATLTHRATNRATRHLKTLKIPTLSTSKKDGTPGWRWRGPDAKAHTTAKWLEPPTRRPTAK